VTARRDLTGAIRQARSTASGNRPGTGRITKVNPDSTAVVDIGGGQLITCRWPYGYTPAAGHAVILLWVTDTMPVLLGVLT
jgi:hypothetical protein